MAPLPLSKYRAKCCPSQWKRTNGLTLIPWLKFGSPAMLKMWTLMWQFCAERVDMMVSCSWEDNVKHLLILTSTLKPSHVWRAQPLIHMRKHFTDIPGATQMSTNAAHSLPTPSPNSQLTTQLPPLIPPYPCLLTCIPTTISILLKWPSPSTWATSTPLMRMSRSVFYHE